MQKSKIIFIALMSVAANAAFGAHATTGWKDVTLARDGSASTCAQTPHNCAYLQLSTGLIFTGSRGDIPYNQADVACSYLTLGGEEGWYLPDIDQMIAASKDHIANISMPKTNWHLQFLSSSILGDWGEGDSQYLATLAFASGRRSSIDDDINRTPLNFLCVKDK